MIMNRDITEPNSKKVDDPVPLLGFFRTPPLMARHKVAIIHEADRMNGAACNALLKTLEEPPAFAKMILTTDSVGSLPATILSRCLAVACEVPLEKDLLASFPEATMEQIRFASGAPGRLQTILERKDQYDRLQAFAQKLPTRKASEALVASEEFQSILESFQKVIPGGVRAANAEAIDALALYFAREPNCPAGWTQRMIEAHRRIVGNGAPGLVLDALFTALLTR
jgi:DNA polymerase-3 subunit delta'